MKKIISFIMIFVILAFSGIGVFADNDRMADDIAKYNSAENMERIQALSAKVEEYAKSASTRSGGQRILNVSLVRQANSYYCGPASVHMVLKYLGYNISQVQLASIMGTDIEEQTSCGMIKAALDYYLGSSVYTMVDVDNVDFGLALYSSIDNNKPVICNVRTGTLPNYNGHNTQHYLVANGYLWAQGGSGSGGVQTVYYMDPNYNDAYYGSYSCPVSVMETAIDNNHDFYYIGT